MTELAAPLALPRRDPALIDYLQQRRSAPAQALAAPGPSEADLQAILTIGLRTPDHGKLFPWRLVVLTAETRTALSHSLSPLADDQPDPTKARAVLAKLTAPPVTVMVVSTPVRDHKVPVWEQELSAGALAMNLSHAAFAHGFSASWITDWYAYDPRALSLFGIGEDERIAGFIHIGTLETPPMERPRPDATAKVSIR
jgi:nitroreductase